MADRDQEKTQEGVVQHGHEQRKHLSPLRADEQDSPEPERPITPQEEAGERKGSTGGLAERDVGPDRG